MTLSTLSDCGKLEAVAEPMAIAFHPWLVSMMTWPGPGSVLRDHAVWSCQSPLPGLIQEFNRRAVELWGRTPKRNAERYCGSSKIFYSDRKPMAHEEGPMARVLRVADEFALSVMKSGGQRGVPPLRAVELRRG